jgi:hypothetical protein
MDCGKDTIFHQSFTRLISSLSTVDNAEPESVSLTLSDRWNNKPLYRRSFSWEVENFRIGFGIKAAVGGFNIPLTYKEMYEKHLTSA